jgi:acyl-CoA reductase-like NAD-dependent aldehyde dehydrogenase
MTRIAVAKTLKMYVGGQFIRSESGHTIPFRSAAGDVMHAPKASRKDMRDAVEIARAAQRGWAHRSAYNRGQIIYRLAEMIEDRAATLGEGAAVAADRAVHHAGWTDKLGPLLSSLNPVGGAYVNYSQLVPLGVVVAVPHPKDGLLGLVEATAAALVPGNAVLLLVPAELAELAARYAEALATSDMPAGVVNVLTGDVASALTWADKHDDVDGLYLAEGALGRERETASAAAAARTIRRVVRAPRADRPADPLLLQRLSEVRTVWISS